MRIDWGWSAAIYSQIGAIGSFSLKPVSGPLAQAEPQVGVADLYDNQDAAGTPEAYKQFVVAGATGSGAPNYAGTRSESASVAVAGNAGQGAAIGAVTGAIVGRRRQTALNNAERQYAEASAQSQRSQSLNNFRRAFSACLESKGYTVK